MAKTLLKLNGKTNNTNGRSKESKTGSSKHSKQDIR